MEKNGNGEGSIYKDKNGRWRGVVTLYCDHGVPKRKYYYGKTKHEVTEKVNKTLADLRDCNYTEPCKKTFYEWMRLWYDTYCEGSLKPSSLINYETYIESTLSQRLVTSSYVN